MGILQAIILGIVQGITEFLPVSSSGHLQLAKELLGIHLSNNISFDVALHAGTVCSTLLVLRTQVMELISGVFSTKFNEAHSFVIKIIISMIPVAIVGFTFKDSLESILTSPYSILVVGVMLLITALLLGFTYLKKQTSARDINYKDSFIIGIAQAFAIMPGISRSGATIATGILLGDKREQVARFSFLMVLVPILGNTLLDLIKGGGQLQIEGVSSVAMLCGFISSFVVGALACRAMIEIVKRGKLIYFSLYCALVGVFSIITYFI